MSNPQLKSVFKRNMLGVMIAYLVAIALGVIAGVWQEQYVMTAAHFISTVFIRLFKFLSIPIICVSIITSLSTLSQNKESGKIFKHTIFYTLLTTILAAALAAVLYIIMHPANVSVSNVTSETVHKIASVSYFDYLQNIVPKENKTLSLSSRPPTFISDSFNRRRGRYCDFETSEQRQSGFNDPALFRAAESFI